ncbi:MAG: stage II sporulation protein R [Clostridia bacterium]|nr:stage II sporulation protein R [Clostridia bacterium]
MRSPFLLLIISVVILLAYLAGTLFPLYCESDLYDKVIRLHVLANSDSTEDQSLKLKVRDEVLRVMGDKLSSDMNIDDAKMIITGELDELRAAAEEKIRELGYSYSVNVSVGEEKYPEREYDEITLPGGKYTSLRVEIGAAEGQNWWCVVFPPLCLGAAGEKNSTSSNEEALIKVGFTEEQYKIITENDKPRYKLKFKILEVFESLFG